MAFSNSKWEIEVNTNLFYTKTTSPIQSKERYDARYKNLTS